MKIGYAKKELIIGRIVDNCHFLTESWEESRMKDALRSAFEWAEEHSETIDKKAPYAIVAATAGQAESEN